MGDETMFCKENAAELVPIRAELYREEAVTISCQQVAQVMENWPEGMSFARKTRFYYAWRTEGTSEHVRRENFSGGQQ